MASPCVIGNCQAGWAVMILAAPRPELFGSMIVAAALLLSRRAGQASHALQGVCSPTAG